MIERSESEGISFLRGGWTIPTRPLVLVHGIGSNAQSFAAMMTRLAATRPVLAWDAPGYGASSPLAGDWPSPDDYAAALEGLADRLGIGRFDLLGHSLGAIIAGRIAVRSASRIGRLILGAPALGYGTRPGAPLAPAAAARLDGMLEEGAEKFAATRGPRLLYARHDQELVAAVVQAMSEVKLPGYAQATRLMSCADLLAEATRIAVPTLVLVGAGDEIARPADCRRLYDAMRAASPALGHRFEEIPEAGHAAPLERPDAFAAAVAAFAPPTGVEA
jgi:pimeloyl-ACP methyl ester carboxylesterase